MVLHLEPAHLGRVEVRLQADGQKLEIVFTAHSAEAERALTDGAKELAAAVIGGSEGRWQQVSVRHERQDGQRDERQQRQGERQDDGRRQGDQQRRQQGRRDAT
jgi:flagellar hook-length control protein FliK